MSSACQGLWQWSQALHSLAPAFSWGQGGLSDMWKLHLFIHFRGKTPTPQICARRSVDPALHTCALPDSSLSFR